MSFVIDGVMPIIPTPFLPSEEIAWEELPGLIEFAIGAGACAACLPAYASEFYKLTESERLGLIGGAVEAARGRLPIVAQVNAHSPRLAIAGALAAAERGASAIATAVPRLFAVSEDDLFAYFDAFFTAVRLPIVIQDFHPGGPTVSAAFLQRLHAAHPHFRYLKLEEPLLAGRIAAIEAATAGGVQVIEGWGGMYTLELAPIVAGVAPGLALTDLLDRVYRLARAGQREAAYPIFQGILPQILYSLQNLELFHHAEKRLLRARGILTHTTVRDLQRRTSPAEEDYLGFLEEQILALLDRTGLARDPRAAQ